MWSQPRAYVRIELRFAPIARDLVMSLRAGVLPRLDVLVLILIVLLSMFAALLPCVGYC